MVIGNCNISNILNYPAVVQAAALSDISLVLNLKTTIRQQGDITHCLNRPLIADAGLPVAINCRRTDILNRSGIFNTVVIPGNVCKVSNRSQLTCIRIENSRSASGRITILRDFIIINNLDIIRIYNAHCSGILNAVNVAGKRPTGN